MAMAPNGALQWRLGMLTRNVVSMREYGRRPCAPSAISVAVAMSLNANGGELISRLHHSLLGVWEEATVGPSRR